MSKAELFYISIFQITVQVKNKICVPSQTREKHVEAKIVLKFPGLPKALFTTLLSKKHPSMLSSNTTDMCHFIACIHTFITPIFI